MNNALENIDILFPGQMYPLFSLMPIASRCNVLYNLPKSSILRLQRIQNQAARILTRTPRRDHVTEVLIDLQWLKIKERIVYKILIFTFNAFIDRTAPLYLCELIEQQKSKTNTRLASDAFLLKLPPPSRNLF